jgi:hypothetical protein
MAPSDMICPEVAARRRAIIDQIQYQINIKSGLGDEGYYVPPAGSLTVSIRRSDMVYVEREIIPNLRKLLRGSDNQPISEETLQVMGQIEIEGECRCDHAPCRCAIRRTLKVTIRKRQGVPAYIQVANANQ